MNILKLFGFAATAFALAFPAHAVEPVAVWSGFNELESGTYTADIGGAVPDATTGAVTLGSRGIKFANSGDAWSGANNGFTVAVKYSNFSSGTAASLVSLQQNSETTAAGIDKIGAWVNANGKVQGIWQGAAYGTANGTLPASGIVFVRYNDSNGTSVHLQNGTSLYAEGGLKSSKNNWGKSFAVGSFANGTSNVASGMTIEAVAIFDSRLSDPEIAAYTFPEPEPAAFETLTYEGFLTTTFIDTGWNFDLTKLDECEITGMMSGSSIANRPAASTGYWIEPAASATGVAKFQMQVYQYQKADDHWLKAVEVELKKGDNRNVWMRAVRTGYVDGGLTDPKGSIKITDWNSTLATSETAGGYGVCKVIVKAPSGTVPRVIAVNFNKQAKNNNDAGGNASNEIGATENSGALDITLTGKAWNQLDGRNGSNYALGVYDVESDEMLDSDVKVAWSSANVYMWTNPTTKFLRGYLDDGNGGASVTVSSVPFGTYDVIVYMATDTESKSGAECRFAPVKINNTFYTWDATAGKVAEGETQWGASRATTAVYGTNALRINGLSGATLSVQVPRKDITGSYGRGGIAAIEIIGEIPVDKTVTREATISEDSTWSDLGWDVAPTASDKAELTVEAKATLTLDDSTAFKSLKLIGSSDLTIAGLDSTNVGLIQKIKLNEFTGKLRYEFDASAGFTADQLLRNTILSAGDKLSFVFKSTVANKGAALAFGQTPEAIKCHVVFDGGTHSMTYMRANDQGNPFGQNGTGANPTLLVTSNATLNFTAKDISYWSGDSDIGGVIRVNDGATLNLLQNGSDTFFYRQRLWLDPGSLTTFNFSAKDQGAGSESCFRWHGGAVQNKEQIYVPESTTDMTAKPAVIKQLGAGALHLASDNTSGLAIFVGAKSKLRLETPITTGGNNPPLIKYGTGVLETIESITTSSFTFTEGTFASSSTVNKLAIGQDVAFDISDGAPTITDTFSAQSKQLKLAIAEPTHMMEVITLPAGTDMTGWTAVVNGNTANPCDLVADGNTLKLKWKIPPTIEVEADDVTVEVADDWNGGVVKVDIGGLNVGDYEGDIRYLLRFGGKVVEGSAQDASASFNLDPSYFTAGNIYRGTFELEYGTGNEPIVAAEVTVYAGEKTYSSKEGWINEHPEPLVFCSTGVYNPESGAAVDDGLIKFSNPTDVVFTPTNSPADYVAKCDSEVTFEIFSGEEAIPDDDDTVADDLQAGVKIVDGGNGTPKFQFISGDEWIDGPAATLNTTYAVTVNFHYAKDETDSDSVTYTVKDLTQEPVVANRRANTAEKLETISFADGTQIASLTGTCQIEVADPVEKGMAPGADEKELKATDETAAQAEAEKIPVLVPSEVEGGLTEGLDDAAAAKAKADYKARFKVVAKPGEGGKWIAVVVPTEDAEKAVEKDVEELSEDVITKVVAIPAGQTESTATIEAAVPGFFYGVAEDGEVTNMGTATPEKWTMAGANGTVELKVTKPANAKARFYKVICSPLPKSK